MGGGGGDGGVDNQGQFGERRETHLLDAIHDGCLVGRDESQKSESSC